jgi:hypothetical protein
MNKRRIHDGIVGVVVTLGVLLTYYVSTGWLILLGILGVTLIQSAFTGFCPVYFVLDKYCPNECHKD